MKASQVTNNYKQFRSLLSNICTSNGLPFCHTRKLDQQGKNIPSPQNIFAGMKVVH